MGLGTRALHRALVSALGPGKSSGMLKTQMTKKGEGGVRDAVMSDLPAGVPERPGAGGTGSAPTPKRGNGGRWEDDSGDRGCG